MEDYHWNFNFLIFFKEICNESVNHKICNKNIGENDNGSEFKKENVSDNCIISLNKESKKSNMMNMSMILILFLINLRTNL